MPMNTSRNKKQNIFVGMSGGVDSSVSALLLKNQGHNVTGVFIKAWHPDFIPCNWRAEMRDAMRICAKLKIPFLLCDLEKEYKINVVDYLINEYKKGRTPNPDVLCNKTIKFGSFLDWSLKNGADLVATGHYAHKESVTTGNLKEDDDFGLFCAADAEKDQTYFLWALSEKQIANIIFPLGKLSKDDVRKIANKNNLHNASKKDSQGICFLGQVDMKNFLRRYISVTPGKIIDTEGKVIGSHDGAELFTMGERHGLKISQNIQNTNTYYVVNKNLKDNTVTVSPENNQNCLISKINISEVNFIFKNNEPPFVNKNELDIDIRTRHRGKLIPAKLLKNGDIYSLETAKKIPNIAPGQSVVFYLGQRCLGGGIVSDTF